MAEERLSSEVLARLQAEGLDPAPADWLERRRSRARSEEDLDALDDPLEAASRYKREKQQEAERERSRRYFRGMPPLEQAEMGHADAGSVPRPCTPGNQAPTFVRYRLTLWIV